MSNMSKTQLINSDASANTNSANSHIELVPGGSAETGPDSVSSTHTQVTNLTSTTVNGPSTSSSSSSPREERLAPPITSADLDSQPVQNILSSVSVQSTSGVCLQVELHDGTVYNVDSRDNPTVVEDLCIQLLKRYFPKMGPAAVQLFGLASIDKKQIPKMLWVNPCITIEELKRHILNSPTAGGKNTFFLRIRYVPGRKFLHNLPALGPEILKYLYLQCKDDFVKSRLSDIYEQDIKNEAKARGYAVLSIVIASKMEEKDCQDILNKQKLEAFLPSHLVVRLWRGYQLRKNMKTKTEEFLAQHSNTKVEELLMGYIKDVLNEVQSYGVERYEAKKVSGSLRPVHITLDVQQHEENGNTQYKGLFIDNEFFSSIDDFRSIHITPNHADQKKLSWNVHLDRSNGCPEVLRFDSKTVAESFVSGVNGYYRLITDYYMNLSQQMELPSLQEINRLKCHGPIDTSTAVRKLKTKYLSDEYYILKQSMQVFDQLAILFCYGGQTRKRLIDKKENMYCLEGENEEEFKDINCLIKYMAETRNLLPKHPMKVKPQQEPVDVLRKLFVEEIIPDDDEEAATNNQRRKPYIILPEEIKIKELIERGTFTEVFVCDLESGTLHAAKRLRQTSNDQMFRCYEHFQHAVQQLIRMEDPKFFVRVHGLVLSTPPMLVMEKAQYGSLASFFRRRQTSQPIKPFHLLNAASQVAQGMLFLNEHQLVHGNLCCRNLLVFRYEIDDILVKIGDPGMVSLMNSLDLSLPQNRSRLLFLAPELYPDCRKCDSKMTPQSDVFAFGTTLWEMFAHGQNPVETRKLKNLSNLEILQTPAHTRLDPPRSLDEATEWKRKVLDLMSLCWKPVEDRPAPNLLLRDLRAQVADYDSSQRGHGYSSIRREFEDDIQDQGRDGNAVPDLISSTQESQPIRPMLSPTLPPVNAAFIPPAPFMPTPSRASLNTESLSNKAGGVYNRSLPELPLDFKYIISSRRLQIQEKQLGSGHYGVVKEGMLFASQDDRSNPQKIAAKELKGDFQNVIDSEEFKEEAVLMSKLEHDNVVKFLGISDNMLILEYVEKGALNMYLRKFRKQNTYLPVWRLMKMISDVAQGMAYLASMRVIHCDLAGRNVLLTDKLVAKITDFGLAKILQKDKDYYTRSTGKELPLMWCSPESIANRKFTTKGDIWSYGILMWEVFTHAKPPVLCSNFSKEGFKKLEEGKRLKRPTHCPELVYQFMEKCWKFKPEERPDFNEACQSCREFAKIYPEPEQRVPDPPPDVPPGVSEPKKEKLTVPPDDKKLPASDNLKYMINTNLIRLEEKIIGKGHFGSVKRGTYTLKGKDIPIAVKVFQAMQRDMIEKEMFKEVDVLGALDNPHIVKLHGFTKKPDIMMIMEYVENGSLKNYLDQTRTSGGRVPESRLIAIVIDIVKGMEYLSEVKVLHCDLAARNILLTKDYMAKIADFGLSKLMTGDKDYYTRKGQDFIPLMWCAPEVIDKTKYSSKTDVWSFGVVLWECFSQGQTPKIFDVGDKELRKVTYYYLEKGGRLTKPSGCHDEVYDLMQKCWEWEADKRPPFNQIFVRCLKMSSLENLPIDIHFNKLLDWLINRRHCIQEWPARAVVIREKINEALTDMPQNPQILELLEGTHINYFHCKKIIELLKKDEESGKKNVFGQYSSQRMKDWSEVIKLYEKDGVYLGETAQMLARNVNYEVPALKKQIAKCQQIKKECERKQTDYTSKAEELRKKYDATCKQMGIEGKKIKTELAALVQDLPAQFHQISEAASKLSKSVQYYDEFVDFVTKRSEEKRDSLPMLKYIMENGNTTTYQWRTGQKPEVIEEAKVFIDTSEENEVGQVTDDIDWGDPGAMTESAIDFGDEIDFNMADITVETGGTEEGDQNPDTGVTGHDSDSNGIDWTDVVIVDKPDAEGVAKGEDAMSLLDNPRTRTLFIDDLMELEAFLMQRLFELDSDSAGGDVLSSSQMQDAPSSLQLQSPVVTKMVSQVRDVIAAFSTVKMHHLLSIRNSPRYVDRLKETLKQMLSLADKMVFLEKQMVVKYKDADSELREIQPKLELVIKRTKEMQKQMESEISNRYKDRVVNIMGEINTM